MAQNSAYEALKQEIDRYAETRHIPEYLASRLRHTLNEAETLAQLDDDIGIVATDPILASLYGAPTV